MPTFFIVFTVFCNKIYLVLEMGSVYPVICLSFTCPFLS